MKQIKCNSLYCDVCLSHSKKEATKFFALLSHECFAWCDKCFDQMNVASYRNVQYLTKEEYLIFEVMTS